MFVMLFLVWVPLLTSLNNTIFDRFETVHRAEPGVWSPERTW